ncbi:hypothetical protein [Marinicellulosiphila megalodicopiae]|uniref:hypothetical protein n=1 Tax=Marinicellulosiphila megalodicopiae TaxID=2724896 RepID=UPI003BAF3B26
MNLINWIEIVSYNGHVREAAIKKLDSPAPSGFFFILLLRRLNDWVENVRIVAREKIIEIGFKTDPELIVKALMLAFRDVNSWQRMKPVDTDVLYQLLSIDLIKIEMRNQIIASESGPQSKILLNILKRSGFDKYLIEISQNSIQPSLRSMVYRILLQKNVLWVNRKEKKWLSLSLRTFKFETFYDQRVVELEYSFENILNSASNDRSSIVRRVAAEFLIKEIDKLDGVAIEMAEKFAKDKSKPVYERGQFALKRLENN